MGLSRKKHHFVPLGKTPCIVILFFGTRPGKRRELPLAALTCPHCGQTGSLQGTVAPHFVHIFWIPVYRLRPMVWVQCSHCKKGYDGRDLTLEMQQALKDTGM